MYLDIYTTPKPLAECPCIDLYIFGQLTFISFTPGRWGKRPRFRFNKKIRWVFFTWGPFIFSTEKLNNNNE